MKPILIGAILGDKGGVVMGVVVIVMMGNEMSNAWMDNR
jgi:hypothetical protein